MNAEEKIILNQFKPRPYQIKSCQAFESGKYTKFIDIEPRRSGKDFKWWSLIIRQAFKRVGLYLYCLPTFAQARSVIWEGKSNTGSNFIDQIPKKLIAKIRNDTMTINLINGSIIRLVGSDSYDTSIVGSNPVGIVFSEYALCDENAYKLAAMPIMKANGGFVALISTPRGKNHLYELFQIARNSPDWFTEFLTIEDTGHISIDDVKQEIASGEISEDLALQEYWCFPASQEVLLYDKIVSIAEVKPNDLVISHKGRPRKVLDIIARDYEGDVIEISSYGSSENIICTPNHPIRVYDISTRTFSWKPAGLITKDDRLTFPKMNLLKDTDDTILSVSLCKVIAWYITEGSCFSNAVQFSLGTYEEVQHLEEILYEANYIPHVITTRTGFSVTVYSTLLSDFLKTHCGSHASTKRIPFALIAGWEHEFFDELMLGDGCENSSRGYEKYVYSTISKTLAYQVQLLAHSLNLRQYAAGISIRPARKSTIEGRSVNCKTSYQVNISKEVKRENSSWLRRAKNCIAASIKDIKRYPYSGTVYNLKVQYDESYLVAGRSVHNCSFEMGQEGSYYAKYLDKMKLRGQIGTVAWEPYHKVFTAWDLGIKDPTVIIFFQVIGETVRIFDYYEAADKPMTHFAQIIADKKDEGYIFEKHFPPHDIMQRESARGLTKRELYAELGVKFTEPVIIDIEDGIELVRRSFSKIWIDEVRCKKLIKALENYREEFDIKRKVYKGRPLHDQFSHGADAMRYLCAALPKTRTSTSANELDKRYREAYYGEQTNMPAVFRDDLPGY